jgi:hypothetical protein
MASSAADGAFLHKHSQGRKVDSHGPAYPGGLQLSASNVAPEGGVRERAKPLCGRVVYPLRLPRLFKQRYSFLYVVFASVLVSVMVKCTNKWSKKCT